MKATVVIPTFNHGSIIRFAIESVLAQSHTNFELFIVGDGALNETRTLVNDYVKEDPRIRFFDNHKGERNGELHRHAALKVATGDFISYLSDDDLYFPNHLEVVAKALHHNDFVHVRTFDIRANGSAWLFPIDLARPFYRNLLLKGHNRIPLSMAAHTMKLYRQLPFGWRTTPKPIFTDLYMWQQILQSTDKVKSLPDVTVLHFSSPERKEFTQQMRFDELDAYSRQISSSTDRERLVRELENLLDKAVLQLDENYLTSLWEKEQKIHNLQTRLHEGLIDAQHHFSALERHLESITSKPTYRVLDKFSRFFSNRQSSLTKAILGIQTRMSKIRLLQRPFYKR